LDRSNKQTGKEERLNKNRVVYYYLFLYEMTFFFKEEEEKKEGKKKTTTAAGHDWRKNQNRGPFPTHPRERRY